MPKYTFVDFADITVGQLFIWGGEEMVKLKKRQLPRYGYVNCRFTSYRAYEDDSGHRYLHRRQPCKLKT